MVASEAGARPSETSWLAARERAPSCTRSRMVCLRSRSSVSAVWRAREGACQSFVTHPTVLILKDTVPLPVRLSEQFRQTVSSAVCFS